LEHNGESSFFASPVKLRFDKLLCFGFVRQNCLTAFCPGLPGWADTRRNIHPLTPILIIRPPLSTSSIYYDPQHPPCSIYMLDSFSTTSIQDLFGLPLVQGPSTSYSMHFIFATHAHTIAACFAVVLLLCHLVLISLSAPYLEICFFSLTPLNKDHSDLLDD